jgi:hypothetical protein
MCDDPYGDLTMDEDYNDPPKDRCGICRYSSEILANKPEHYFCVYFSKHVKPNERACNEFLPPRKTVSKVYFF